MSPPTTTTISTHEASAAFNATNLALAKSQRLLASWIPPHPQPLTAHKYPFTTNLEQPLQQPQEEEAEKEEQELFTSLPDLPGLGAGKGDDEGGKRGREREGNEKLRRELLGKGAGRGQGNVNMKAVGSKPRAVPIPAKRKEHQDSISDDEEGGRTSLGKAKNGVRKRVRGEGYDDAADDDGIVVLETEKKAAAYSMKRESKEGLRITMKSKRGGGNYLDEVLADRLLKKKKRRKK